MSFTAPDAATTPEIAGAAEESGTSEITIAPGPSATVLYIASALPPAACYRFEAIGIGIVHQHAKRLRREFAMMQNSIASSPS
jgi:hypothetical protein